MTGPIDDKLLLSHSAMPLFFTHIKEKAASNILLQTNWQEAARCESIKIQYLKNLILYTKQ